jgi:hypothetical protein
MTRRDRLREWKYLRKMPKLREKLAKALPERLRMTAQRSALLQSLQPGPGRDGHG